MTEDVDKPSERVADIEAPDAPGLVGRTILDFQPGLFGALLGYGFWRGHLRRLGALAGLTHPDHPLLTCCLRGTSQPRLGQLLDGLSTASDAQSSRALFPRLVAPRLQPRVLYIHTNAPCFASGMNPHAFRRDARTSRSWIQATCQHMSNRSCHGLSPQSTLCSPAFV